MVDDAEEEHKRLIEREARRGRKFTLADVIGREGRRFFDGESPVPMLARVNTGLCMYIDEHVQDPSGALKAVLKRKVRTSENIVGEHFDDPLEALEIILERLIEKDSWFHEFVRQVDAEWGRIMVERPHFQSPGSEPHPDDEHTHETVRSDLEALLQKMREPAAE